MISAGITAFFSLFGLVYVFMGLMFTSIIRYMPNPKEGPTPPQFFGWIFAVIGFVVLIIGLTVAVLKWQAARCLKQRRSLTFCRVIAGISCLEVPYGTVLGILTYLALGRTSVQRLFNK
jgi:hypothetical protein